MSDQTPRKNYIIGYDRNSVILPYPRQTDLPRRDQQLERYYAVSQWMGFVNSSPNASQALRSAWKEEQRDAGNAVITQLLFTNERIRRTLQSILDYAENPNDPTINAGGMTEAELLIGIAGQAQFGIDTLDALQR
jgi:hypothetical protein